MWVCTRVFHVPKRGNAADEYEDAFFPKSPFARCVNEFRCAVADGASESAYSGLWAQMLVRGFGLRRMRMEHLTRLWERATKYQPVPWYLEKKLKNGAHAAFVGLHLRDDTEHNSPKMNAGVETPRFWRALGVGDSCIFQIREDELITVGPLKRAEQFDNSPYLIASKARQKRIRKRAVHVTVMEGDWQPGDTFFLVTDALAHWLLSELEADRTPWAPLRDLCADEDETLYSRLVDELRTNQGLHNDDTTLMQVEVD